MPSPLLGYHVNYLSPCKCYFSFANMLPLVRKKRQNFILVNKTRKKETSKAFSLLPKHVQSLQILLVLFFVYNLVSAKAEAGAIKYCKGMLDIMANPNEYTECIKFKIKNPCPFLLQRN